jgi:hypothetical protein
MCRVQPQVRATQKNSLDAQRLSDMIERLRERMARLVRLALRPQQCQKLVAGDSLVAGGGDDGQNREEPPLRGRARQAFTVARKVDTAKCSEP